VNNIHLPEDADTVARRLSSAGYATGYIGKWHLASSGPRSGPDDFRVRAIPEARRGGYKDYWLAADALEWTSHGYGGRLFDKDNHAVEFGEEVHRVDFMTDRLLEQLEAFAGDDRPFYMMASYLEPHHQNDTDEYEAPHGLAEKFRGAEIPGDLAALGGSTAQHYVDYLGCVAALDIALGRVLEKLDDLGIAGETLVVFISDHGCHFKTRNGEYKRSCHDASIHLPMVLRGPGFEGGKVADAFTSLLDVPATLLNAAGVEVPAHWHGQPLQELGAEDWRTVHMSQLSESQVGRCLRTERWTYSVRVPGAPWAERGELPPMDAEVYVEDFLYDNAADPDQLNNLAADPDYAEVRAELRRLLLRELRKAGEPSARLEPAPGAGPDPRVLGAAESAR
jgi:uncharacterized sulfatase